MAATDEDLAMAWENFCGNVAGVRVHRGSILELRCDALVSPANSFGFMGGGIDAAYVRHFGAGLQDCVREMIRTRHEGELPVGAADVVETGDERITYLIVAPTMRVPMVLRDSIHPYLAAKAVLRLIQNGERSGQLLRETIRSVAFRAWGREPAKWSRLPVGARCAGRSKQCFWRDYRIEKELGCIRF